MVQLAGLCSNTQVLLWKYFLDVINFYNQWTLYKTDYTPECEWASYNQLNCMRALRTDWGFWKKKESASRLQHRHSACVSSLWTCPLDFRLKTTSTLTWISSHSACPMDFRLASSHSSLSQYLKINLYLYVYKSY